MYEFRTELKDKLLEGRTMTYIANKIGISISSVINILNGKTNTRKLTAMCIVKSCKPDDELEDYFVKKEK